MSSTIATIESLKPDAAAIHAVLAASMEGEDDAGSFSSRHSAKDIPFFKLTLMDKLLHRPYHVVELEGPFKLQELAEDYRAQTFRSERSIDRSGNPHLDRLLLRLDGETFGYLEDRSFKIYAPTPEAAQAAAKTFRRYVKPQAAGQPFFYTISNGPQGPDTELVYIERSAPVSSAELVLNYGEDFLAWEAPWIERLRGKPSGLTIFHGPPGCGKTSYLRALMSRMVDNAVFYFVPVSEAEMLSSSRFLSFWMVQTLRHRKKRKIAILEDAEELLLPRDAGSRDKVSSLLNLADGFLGDHLKLHIIATTNAPVRALDAALLRPGRLTGIRECRRLTRVEAQRLATAKSLSLTARDDYSLAEVYCSESNDPILYPERPVGFAQ